MFINKNNLLKIKYGEFLAQITAILNYNAN